MNSPNGSASKSLNDEKQAAIRARVLATLNASRLQPLPAEREAPGAAASPAGAQSEAVEAARAARQRCAELETELASARERLAELEARLGTIADLEARSAALEEASRSLQRDKARVDEQLAVAVRRIEGFTEETTVQRQKVAALEQVVKRITSHRIYRWWDKWRMITGKPALHGPRQDPLGIKPAMPS